MNRWTWTIGIVVIAGAAITFAQPPDGPPERGERRGPPGERGGNGPPPPSPIRDALDADHDHVISAEEIKNASAALLALDKNKDGKLTEDEFRPPMGRGPDAGRPGERREDAPNGRRPGGPPPPRRDDGDDRRGEGRPPSPDGDHGRPVEKIAKDLGVTPEQFREAFKKVKPAPRGERPTEAQREANRKVLSEALGVSPEKLDAVMDKYRPEGRDSDREERGPPDRGPEGRGPEGRGPEGRDGAGNPPPHDPERFVEHAMEFDADNDGKLNKDELRKLAEEMGRRRGRPPGGEEPERRRPPE